MRARKTLNRKMPLKSKEDIFGIFRRIWSFLVGRDILLYLFFVILALLIWISYTMNSMRMIRIEVPIVYSGATERIVLSDTLPRSLQIEIRDAGSQLRVYNHKPPVLHLDIAQQTKANEGEIRFSSEELRHNLAGLLKGSTALQNIYPETIEGGYFHQAQKEVEVVFAGTYEPAMQFHILAGPLLNPHRVNVYGPKSQLDTLKQVYTRPAHITGIEAQYEDTLSVRLPKGISTATPTVKVLFAAEEFTEKKFTIPISVAHMPQDKAIRLYPKEVEVSVAVGLSQFATITDRDIRVVCDYPTGGQQYLTCRVEYKNEHIYSARVSPRRIDFIVENAGK